MWDRIFTKEAIDNIIEISEETEDKDSLKDFTEFIEAEIDYKVVVVLATQWHMLEDIRQANLAIHYAGEFHASRFIMLMDTLSKFIKEGRLK